MNYAKLPQKNYLIKKPKKVLWHLCNHKLTKNSIYFNYYLFTSLIKLLILHCKLPTKDATKKKRKKKQMLQQKIFSKKKNVFFFRDNRAKNVFFPSSFVASFVATCNAK